METDCLNKVVVDVQSRKFYLYSDETVDEFMNVLDVCKKLLDEDILKYASVV